MMDATHTVNGYGEIHSFSANACCQRVMDMYPGERSPLSVVAEANVRLGERSIRRIVRPSA